MRDTRWTFSFEDGSAETFEVWSQCDIPLVVFMLLQRVAGNVEFDEGFQSGTSALRGRFTFDVEVCLAAGVGCGVLLRLSPERIMADVRSVSWLAQTVELSSPGLLSD